MIAFVQCVLTVLIILTPVASLPLAFCLQRAEPFSGSLLGEIWGLVVVTLVGCLLAVKSYLSSDVTYESRSIMHFHQLADWFTQTTGLPSDNVTGFELRYDVDDVARMTVHVLPKELPPFPGEVDVKVIENPKKWITPREYTTG